jgi:hypothetical protein
LRALNKASDQAQELLLLGPMSALNEERAEGDVAGLTAG